jgi:hypothetical protein
MATPCLEVMFCKNSPENRGEQYTKCDLCRLSPINIGRSMVHFWSPTKEARGMGLTKHPIIEEEKRNTKASARLFKLDKKRNRDKGRIKTSRLATAAEKATERNIIHATMNSGRRNKDGDHVHKGNITLDTKLQTTRDNPVILLAELEKVRSDAMRSGKLIGGLVIRNKQGVGVVVITEADFALLTKGL